jgi:phosphoribosylanthranilate isomerase
LNNNSKVIKICGIRRPEDALFAVSQGANSIGFVAYPKSPRFVSPVEVEKIISAVSPRIRFVGVFVDPKAREISEYSGSGLNVIQIHLRYSQKNEKFGMAIKNSFPSLEIWIALNTSDEGENDFSSFADAVLYDSFDPVKIGGTGALSDWQKAAEMRKKISRKFILAGGLSPENVAAAIKYVLPDGVDVSSGVESRPGVKDKVKMKAFIKNAVRAFAL